MRTDSTILPGQSGFRIAGLTLLIFQAVVIALLIPKYSATWNESSHVLAGLTYWHRGEFGLYKVNPPLPRLLMAAPLLSDGHLCLDAIRQYDRNDLSRQEYELGTYFADTNSLWFHGTLCKARGLGIVWAFGGGLLIWIWANEIAGARAGFLAVALWVTEPMITAHAALATCDVPAAVTLLAAAYASSKFLQDGTWHTAFVSGIALGAALLCKSTAVLIVPVGFAAWMVRRLRIRESTCMSRLPRCRHLLMAGVVSLIVLNCGYGWQNTCRAFRSLQFRSEQFRQTFVPLQNSFVGKVPCPVPAAFVEGLDVQQRDFECGMQSYLRGERRARGWWYYYAYAFAVKSPVGHLLFYTVALAAARLRFGRFCPFLWGTPAVLLLVCSGKTGFTEHLRYILPAYPFLFIVSAAAVVTFVRNSLAITVACVLLTVISLISAASQFPALLGYFNEPAGSGESGWRHLSGSNVDWGQDLMFLREWLDRQPQDCRVAMDLRQESGVDPAVYLGERFESPRPSMRGYAVVDSYAVTGEYRWLWQHRLTDRIGTSLFVFQVNP